MSEARWGSADHHRRECAEMTRRRRLCPFCPRGSGKRATHAGTANGVTLMIGCEWHVRQWVKRGPRALPLHRPPPIRGAS
jgi:hypothetical protein